MAKMMFQLTRVYGNVSATFGLESDDVHGANLTILQGELIQQVNLMFDLFERDELPKQMASAVWGTDKVSKNASASASASVNAKSYPLDKIVLTREGVAIKLRVFGGSWAKFGVPLYPENISSLPESLMKDLERNGVLVFSEGNAEYTCELKDDGKPKKVIGFKFTEPPF